MTPAEFAALLGNRYWRLNNLYKIRDPDGKAIQFRLNYAQEKFYKDLWYFNCVLKARQLGFSTFILIYSLDSCLFNDNHSVGVVAQSLVDSVDLFQNKVKFAYDNLPDALKTLIPAEQDSARKLVLGNGSSISVGTSLRSGTFQKLHVSEYGKISAKFPDKAREIKTGAFNTVHEGNQIFVESTAEGQGGEFYDLCQRAIRLKDSGHDLTPMDPKFHFFPWFENPDYMFDDDNARKVLITREDLEYFDDLQHKSGISLSPGQKSWYVKKKDQQGEDMKREFPSTPDEAFEAAVEGAYYSRQLGIVRRNQQIGRVPHNPSYPVYTFWDLGIDDMQTIWFMQHIGQSYLFIDYFEDHNEGIQYYADILNERRKNKGYHYEAHYFPHDGKHRDPVTGQPIYRTAQQIGISPIQVVDRTPSLREDIQLVRNILPQCWFDEVNCAKGIAHLANYRKEWDDKLGVWRDKPRHDDASHGEAAFRTFARGFKPKAKTFYQQDSYSVDIMDI